MSVPQLESMLGPEPRLEPEAPATPRRLQHRGWVIARRVVTRLAGAVLVLWAAATFTFFIQALLPGSRATLILNEQSGQQQRYTAAQLAPINRQFGFDRSILSQYGTYITNLAHGNLGTSYTEHQPVATIIARQVGPTLALTLTALGVAWVVALLVTIATARRGRILSAIGSGFEIITAGLPYYWLGVILLVVFAIDLKVFPVQGGTSLQGLVLPALTLGIPLAGFIGQVTRERVREGALPTVHHLCPCPGDGRPAGAPATCAAARGAPGHHALRVGAGRPHLRSGDRGDGLRPARHRNGDRQRGPDP